LPEILRNAAGTRLVNKTGIRQEFRLLPPLTPKELRELEAAIPCPLPEEMRNLFAVTRGFECGQLGLVDLAGLPGGFGLEEVCPHALSIAGDECGNFWVIDLTSESQTWGPIYYTGHDAPVFVYQTDSLAHFIAEALRGETAPWKSEIWDVQDKLSQRVWQSHPGVLSYEECAGSKDEDLRTFARSLETNYEFIDLRTPKLGDGFSWGRYGPWTVNKRFGEKRVFACQRKTKLERFKEFWRR
jgi:cell wall assembly regulator SMI1